MEKTKVVVRGNFPSSNHRNMIPEKSLDKTITQIQVMRCVRRILKIVNKNKS